MPITGTSDSLADGSVASTASGEPLPSASHPTDTFPAAAILRTVSVVGLLNCPRMYCPTWFCPRPDASEWRREIDLVRQIDGSHPIASTVSGELEAWLPVAGPVDDLGISLYRTTWNPTFGYFHYPIPAWFYRVRALAVRPFVDSVEISELQAEPWFGEPISNNTPAEWATYFTPRDLADNVSFAARTGISETNLWGAEWWFWLKKHGDSGLWDEARRIFSAR